MTQLNINGNRFTVLQVLYKESNERDAALQEYRERGAVIEECATVHHVDGVGAIRCHLAIFPLDGNTVTVREPKESPA
jgi:hypothetical protein